MLRLLYDLIAVERLIWTSSCSLRQSSMQFNQISGLAGSVHHFLIISDLSVFFTFCQKSLNQSFQCSDAVGCF